MSYSDIINQINNQGFYETMIAAIERSMDAGKAFVIAKNELQTAEIEAKRCSEDLKSIIKHAAENCEAVIVDNTEPGKIVLRLIQASCLWEITSYDTGEVTATSRVCNMKK